MKMVLKTFLIFLFSCSLFAQEQIRVMGYNLLNYPNNRSGTNITAIEPFYKKIINTINPDALVVVEMVQQAGVNQFLTNVLGNDYSAATVTIKGTNSSGDDGNNCAFYYKPSKLTLIESKEIPARTRVISSFKVVHNTTKDTLIILGVHLKANVFNSDNVLNQEKRTDAVISLRNETVKYRANANFLVCGDFNIFSSNEKAFQKLIDKSTSGYAIDMLNVTGNWSANPTFSSVSTYSANKLDTRLDMILISQGLQDKGGVDYINDSYKIFGNDNNHFSKAVNQGVNTWFLNDASMGTALVLASDHLPIYADFSFGVATNIDRYNSLPEKFELEQNYPNPFNPTTTINYKLQSASHVTLKVYDVLGREVATLVDEYKPAGNHSTLFMPRLEQGKAGALSSSFSSGVYFYRLTAKNHSPSSQHGFAQTRKMLFLK
ncbi:MAG: endonuclease/exonuclease/phosphatase [Ignavibacteria bacterium]|nr:MAG: endonuclease/exonuclease/phosphatase [Ignavibacteria bacterium]KAF0160456.1 MAG: endonuclease/exonuclease/phosphatase [Ignavibacteria bacterium]